MRHDVQCLHAVNSTSSSAVADRLAVADRPCDAPSLSVVSFSSMTARTPSFITVT